jgi:hypothetical protein
MSSRIPFRLHRQFLIILTNPVGFHSLPEICGEVLGNRVALHSCPSPSIRTYRFFHRPSTD